jgi:murein DD-endopeptidase MepM/ murein hydrolase activator NlpD
VSRRRSLVRMVGAAHGILVLICTLALSLPCAAGAKTARKSGGRSPARATVRKPATHHGAASTVHRASRASRSGKRAARGISHAGTRTAMRAHRSRRAHGAASAGSGGYLDEHVHVRKGETLDHLLAMNGFAPGSAAPWLHASDGVYDLRQIRPHHGFTLRFDRATHELDSIRYEIDRASLLVVERDPESEEVHAHVEALPYFRETRGIAGRIERGLREDTVAAGVPPSVASSLAEIFGWDLDVEHDLEPGDEFRVIYQNIWEVGKSQPVTGEVVGAEIVAHGRTYSAMRFEDERGVRYYRPTGESLTRTFLRYPVEFTEISSEYSASRFHPILHRERPHLGVDLAAPSGTPVRAAASGWVSAAGRNGGLGIAVRIQHDGDVATTYGHLCEIAPGVREGGVVERGQVIGWVGSTGLATGPHLHYEIERGGTHVDPMAMSAPVEGPVGDVQRRTFERVRSAVGEQLAALPETDVPVRVAITLAQRTE